jgi:hypothetical protein
VRVVDLTVAFHKTRPAIGSTADLGVRRVIQGLASEYRPLPGVADREVFRTPHGTCWARSVPGTSLELQYTFAAPVVRAADWLD